MLLRKHRVDEKVMTPLVFRIWVKKTQEQISTHMVLCFLQ